MTAPDKLLELRDRLLRDSGFVDIEDKNGNVEPLAKPHGLIAPERGPASFYGEVAAYYQAAGQFLHEHQFPDGVERRVWELHAEGASYTRIARTVLREQRAKLLAGKRIYRRRVHAIVSRLRLAMRGQTAEQEGRKPLGRPRAAHSLRADGVWLTALLSRPACEALDHIQASMKVSRSEAVRRALVVMARGLPLSTECKGRSRI